MRRSFSILSTLIALLCLPSALANPIIPEYINELYFNAGSWTLETGMRIPSGTLDGWTLSSREGSATFTSGITVGNKFVLLTPDSLTSPLAINPLGDSLSLRRTSYEQYSLLFGDGPNCAVLAPAPGSSICFDQFFYLDLSPTLGAANDTAGAMATVSGVVRDSATLTPLPGAQIRESPGRWDFWWTTSDSGEFDARVHAHNFYLVAALAGYNPGSIFLSLRPGESVDTVLLLSRMVSATTWPHPETRLLLQCFPNPFNPSTTITYILPSSGRVTLQVYDILGSEVAELVRGSRQPGEYRVSWNGLNDKGTSVRSGVYLARLRVETLKEKGVQEETVKLLLVR